MTKKIKDAMDEVTKIGGRTIPVSPERIAAREKFLATSAELEKTAAEISQEIAKRFRPFIGEAVAFSGQELVAKLVDDARAALKARLHAALVADVQAAHDAMDAEIAEVREAKGAAARSFKASFRGRVDHEPSEITELRTQYAEAITFQSDLVKVLWTISNDFRKNHGHPVGEATKLPLETLFKNAAKFEPALGA